MIRKETDDEMIRLYENGYKQKEIAEKLGMKLDAVKWRFRYLRKKGVKIKRWWNK